MKKYKLLKDLPTFKAGQMFVLLAENEKKAHYLKAFNITIYKQPGLYMINDNGEIDVLAYHQSTLIKFPNVLDDWFEEIKESKVWKPKEGEEYWYTYGNGDIESDIFPDESDNIYSQSMAKSRVEIGNCFKAKEEAEKAIEKLKALRRLREKGLTFNFARRYTDGKDGAVIIQIYFGSDKVGKDNDDPSCYDKETQKDLDLLFEEESKDV